MRKKRVPPFRAMGELMVREPAAQAVRLDGRNVTVEISVLAEDLFRLRMARGRHAAARPSWAVIKMDWAPVKTRIDLKTESVSVRTRSGDFILDLKTGAWKLADAGGLVLFEAGAGKTGFAAERPQFTLNLSEDEGLFGWGESTGPLNKRGLVREFWNIDVLGHSPVIHPGLRRLYVSIPFGISLRHGRAAGLFWDNPAHQIWDGGSAQLDAWKLEAASGQLDLYLFLGPSPAEILSRYTDLTGRMPMPPRWMLGYQQSRYSYETRARVEEIARQLRERRIPCDAIHLDIHHMHGYRVFTYGRAFPNPKAMSRRLAAQGFKLLNIVDPGVKDDPKFGVLKRGLALKAFVKAPKGNKDFIGKVWPGEVRYPDFTNARVRQWWGREQARLLDSGVAGFWNDMNEPANFASPNKSLPDDCRHQSDHGPRLHAEAHNVYGLQMARACYEGCLAHQPQRRPAVITRDGYAGVQRYSVVWTGDNSSFWEHLAESIPMLLNLGASGVAFCGADVGGFKSDATGELVARWTQLAALTPFFRNHCNIHCRPQEPWAFGPKVEAICRRYIELRYQLLPYLYGLFLEAHRHGTPMVRPLFWHYANDPEAVAIGDQFLLGPDLLVAPVVQPGAGARSVYLPRGTWFNFWTGERLDGARHILARAPLDTLPLFVRGGAVIPMGPVQQHVGEQRVEVANLHVWASGRGERLWYEDDGESQEYLAGKVCERTIHWSHFNGRGQLRIGAPEGTFASEIKQWRLIVRGLERPCAVRVNGRRVRAQLDREFEILSCVFPTSPEAIEVAVAAGVPPAVEPRRPARRQF